MVQRFLDAEADVNVALAEHLGLIALQAAASSGNLEVLQVFLNAGADVNAEPAAVDGRTAFQAAAQAGHVPIALAPFTLERTLMLCGQKKARQPRSTWQSEQIVWS
jgi:ankyrin repeat protein